MAHLMGKPFKNLTNFATFYLIFMEVYIDLVDYIAISLISCEL